MSQTLPRPVPGRTLYPVAMALVALLILGNLALIFGFSSESREESGSRSREVTLVVAKILYPNLDSLPEEEQKTAVESLHGYVRKAAHFLEFALLGCLTATLATLIRGYFVLSIRGILTAGAPGVFCLLTAAAILRDEPLVADGREGINGLTISNAMRLSAWTGKTVTLPFDEEKYRDLLFEHVKNSRRKENIASVVSSLEGTYGS